MLGDFLNVQHLYIQDMMEKKTKKNLKIKLTYEKLT